MPWDAYARATIEISWDADATIRLDPQPDGATIGRYPDGVEVVHVITAHNPGSEALSPSENARRNEALEAAMRRAGWAWRPAVGAASDPDDPWEEASFAVVGQPRRDVLDLARGFDQAAIYEWTPAHLAMVAAAGDVRSTVGWRATWR